MKKIIKKLEYFENDIYNFFLSIIFLQSTKNNKKKNVIYIRVGSVFEIN